MRNWWFGFVLLFLCCEACWAQLRLTLDDCLRLAFSSRSEVDIARQEVAALEQGVREATADLLPQSRLTNAYIYNSPLRDAGNQFSFISLNGVRQYTSQYTLVQEVDLSGRLRAGLSRARSDRAAASARVRLAERDLKLAVQRAYYEVLRSQHQLEALQQFLLEAEAFERRALALEKGGEVARADVMRARVQVAGAALAVENARLELGIAENELLSFWTSDMQTRPALEDVFTKPLPSPDDLFRQVSYSGRPEFAFLNARRLSFEAEARRARANLFPQPALIFQYGLDSLRFTGHDRGFATFVSLNIPVFDWGRALAGERRAKRQAEKVVTERAIADRRFARELANVRAALRARFDQVSTAGDQVKSATESLRLAELRYAGGEGAR